MGLVLDTSAYIALLGNNPAIARHARRADVIFLPAVVFGELLFGYHKGNRLEENRQRLRLFMNSDRVQLLPIDEAIAERYGALKQSQGATGAIVADNDLWIAAACLHLDQPLLTLDSDFKRIGGLELLSV